MWPFKKKTPVELEENETRIELVALQNAEEQMGIALGILDQQIEAENEGQNPINSNSWKELIVYLSNAMNYIEKSKKEDKHIRKIINKAKLDQDSEEQVRIDHKLENLISVHDDLIEQLDKIKAIADANLTSSKKFTKIPAHKNADSFNKDAPLLVKQFKTPMVKEEVNQILEMTTGLITRIRNILEIESSLDLNKSNKIVKP